jgi:hypothetical protein
VGVPLSTPVVDKDKPTGSAPEALKVRGRELVAANV